MCDVKKHDTGWKVVSILNKRELRFNGSWDYSGTYYNVCLLSLRCRTEHCIEAKLKQIEGHWSLRDFTKPIT